METRQRTKPAAWRTDLPSVNREPQKRVDSLKRHLQYNESPNLYRNYIDVTHDRYCVELAVQAIQKKYAGIREVAMADQKELERDLKEMEELRARYKELTEEANRIVAYHKSHRKPRPVYKGRLQR